MSYIIRKVLKVILGITTLVFVITLSLFSLNEKNIAYAREGLNDFSVKQSSNLYYIGENYIISEESKKTFLDAFTFTLNGTEITPDAEKITLISDMNAIKPGKNYKCVFKYFYNDRIYQSEEVSFEISKRNISVTVLLNGTTDLTIEESEIKNIKINYDYVGAVDKDVRIETVNGVTVRTLNDDVLTNKAYVETLPKTPVEKYTVVAGNARSDYYNFSYEKSTLTITRTLVPELKLVSENDILVALNGSFSSVYSLNFKDIGTSTSSAEYVEIESDVERKYANSGTILTDNEVVACYNISVISSIDGSLADNVSATVRIRLADNLKNKNSYRVIALYNNGNTDILNASLSEEYLIFNAADMGDFLIITPIEGIGLTTYIIAGTIGVAAILIVVILVALFRKKY